MSALVTAVSPLPAWVRVSGGRKTQRQRVAARISGTKANVPALCNARFSTCGADAGVDLAKEAGRKVRVPQVGKVEIATDGQRYWAQGWISR